MNDLRRTYIDWFQLLLISCLGYLQPIRKLMSGLFLVSLCIDFVWNLLILILSTSLKSEVKIPEALTTMSPNHTLEIHQARPYTLWSGSLMINNRIICTVNMYSDHFVACPFYLWVARAPTNFLEYENKLSLQFRGADIKLNSEFQTDKLFSHFFLDKLDQLNKKELTIWNNIYYTYVKLKGTETMTSKLVKVEKYLQDKDSVSFLSNRWSFFAM